MTTEGPRRAGITWRTQPIVGEPADEDLAALTPREQRRAAGTSHPGVRSRFVVGRALLRRTVAERLPGLTGTSLDVEVEPSGRPRVAAGQGLEVSLTHTPGLAAVAVSTAGAVGIDAEVLHRCDLPPASVWLTPDERRRLWASPPAARPDRLLALWVAKEAVIKACDDLAPVRRRDIDVDDGVDPVPTGRPTAGDVVPAATDDPPSAVCTGRGSAIVRPQAGGEHEVAIAWYEESGAFLVALAAPSAGGSG